ncbi:MAG: FAD-dependent oxidoreductase [Acetatifactor sp.]|nr:FAD-dependent oxidoreductase [Acetatifactor sp.]
MKDLYDVIVVGGGPAGLTSAIYLARAKYRVLVLEKEKVGGQITITEEIVNYPGVEKASGTSLTEGMRRQAEHFGAEFQMGKVTKLELSDDIKRVRTEAGMEYEALGIVLAVGASPRKIGFQGEREFQGRGVAYCATCDGEFFTGREVLVVGGGFAAVEEAIFLTKYASKVTMIVREPDFTCAAGVSDKLLDYPDIQVYFNTEVKAVEGEKFLSQATLWNNETGEEWRYVSRDGKPFGVFVFAGYEPATKWLAEQVGLNEQGYILTDREQATDVSGVYAAGDVCVKGLRQVVTAVGDGAVAATSLEHYVSKLREKLGMSKANWEKEEQSVPKAEVSEAGTVEADAGGALIDEVMRSHLAQIFVKFEQTVTVAAVLTAGGAAGSTGAGSDAYESNASKELEQFAKELEGISDKVKVVYERVETDLPYLEIRVGERSNGIRYYSVPGGHEFNSFVLALYNTAGPGQPVEEGLRSRIAALGKNHTVQIMTTLSCTNCPDVVSGTQHIAALSEGISAWMYDLAKFPEYKEQYGIMAVPCMVVDGEETYFGKKSMEELVEILEQA